MISSFPDQKRLKFVILDCPYFHLEREETQRLFSKMLNLKIQGYRSEYPVRVMPVDSTDYVGTHILICEENNQEWIPISGFKSVSYQRCQEFQLNFPVFDLFRGQSFPDHKKAVQNFIKKMLKRSQSLYYNGSWTICPDVRANPELVKWIRELTIASFCFYYERIQSNPVLAAAVQRFKVHRLKESIGFKPLYLRRRALDAFSSPAFFGEELLLMGLTEFSPIILEKVQPLRKLWEERITISASSDENGLQRDNEGLLEKHRPFS